MIIHHVGYFGFEAVNRTPEEIRDFLYDIESRLKKCQLVELPVIHKHADGIYYREIFIPKGSWMTGRVHKQSDLNIVYYGEVDVFTSDGGIRKVIGPESFQGKAGIKQFGMAIEDTLWATAHATSLTDLDEIEKELFEDEQVMYDFITGKVKPEVLQ